MTKAASAAARRYAEAAFAVAREKGDLKGWQEDLAFLERLLGMPEAVELFANPRLDSGKRIGIALGLVPREMKPERQNLLKLLVLARRTDDIHAIRDTFEALVAEAEDRVELSVTLARDPDADERSRITKQLTERAGQAVTVDFHVDPAILGGLVIRRDDHVVDGSVRRRLLEMREQLIAS